MASNLDSKVPVMMPPRLVVDRFLGAEKVGALLEHVLSHREAFRQTGLGHDDKLRIDRAVRMSLATREMGDCRAMLEDSLLAVLPELSASLGAEFPRQPRLELQLAAHNDGAFYTVHRDVEIAASYPGIRVLSAVYYFHREPKRFSGGKLRFHAIGPTGADKWEEVEPLHDRLVVFPAWAPHEVMPVACPSGDFADSRFALNCWVHR